jgi:hypothetical protein
MGLVCPENPEPGESRTLNPAGSARINELGEDKSISVSPAFRVAAKRAFNALQDLESYYTLHSSQEDNSEHARHARAALEEVEVQTSPQSKDSSLPESYARGLLSAYFDELNLIDSAKMGKRAYELLSTNVLVADRESSPARIAASKNEIPEALDGNLLPNEWANRKASTQCFPTP